MRGFGVFFFASMLAACSATDFSKQGAPATTDGGVVLGPDGGVVVDDSGVPSETGDGGKSGALDCATVQPTPTYCTTFPTSARPAEYDRWGTTDFSISNVQSLSPSYAMAFSLTGPTTDTAPANNSSNGHLARTNAPNNEITFDQNVYLDMPSLDGHGTAVVWDMIIGSSQGTLFEVYIDITAGGANLKGPPNSAVIYSSQTPLPLQRWFRVRARIHGVDRQLDVEVDGKEWVKNRALNASAPTTGFETVLGLKYVNGSNATWSMYVDDVVLWAR